MKPGKLRTSGVAMTSLFLLACFTPQADLVAQNRSSSELPLEQILNADGTLRTQSGYTGTVDPRGWKMMVGPDGRPRFLPATPGSPVRIEEDTADIHWDGRFVGPPGVDAPLNAVAVIGTDVFLGGTFLASDRGAANSIVKWSSTERTWTSLGDGVDGEVLALAVRGSDLYVGGEFTHAGGAPANHIAKWNGSTWSTLGSSPGDGTNGLVYSLAVSGSDLYVGGGFTAAGNAVAANNIAKWDGTNWSALGSGVGGRVYALAVMGSDLYAGGNFGSAGNAPARYVARWTGSAWATLGTSPNDGVNGAVYALAAATPYLYVGGGFAAAGAGVAVNGIARWNGSGWNALGNGFTPSSVTSIVVDGKSVYAAGSFSSSGILAVNHAASWDTMSSTWSSLSGGTDNTVNALAMLGSKLIAAGAFISCFNGTSLIPTNYVAAWTGTSWEGVGTSAGNSVGGEDIFALAVSGSDIYVGGSFSSAGPTNANNIVRYNGASNTWNTLGSGAINGVDNEVSAIAVAPSGDVYVGGYFSHAGGAPANGIAKWNGSSWSTLGTSPNDGVNGFLQSIAISGSNVFVGGYFNSAGGSPASFVARWNGTAWSALGSGMNSIVLALAVAGSDLYAAGAFSNAGGADAHHVARWNGTTWVPLGASPNDGTNDDVFALAVSGTSLVVGGQFDHVAGSTIEAHGVALWNGSSWSALGNGVSRVGSPAQVFALAVSGGALYATGIFSASGILDVNNIARWDTAGGGSWSALGSGLSATGRAVVVSGNDIYVGGDFSLAGSKPSFRFGRWNPSLTATSVEERGTAPRHFSLAQNYPNPFNPSTEISYQLSVVSEVRLNVYDILGREVAVLIHEVQQAGRHVVRFNANRLASGYYFYRLLAGSEAETKEMLLLK